MEFVIFAIALTALIWGADLLITQSEKIALRFGISEFIIGATLIALGTSLPEMAASVVASWQEKAEIAVSNVVGSNILNITLVLAGVFLIAKKIDPDRDFFAKDSLWALMPVVVFVLMMLDSQISRFEGMLLLLMMGAYLMFLLQDSKNPPSIDTQEEVHLFSWTRVVLLALLGLVLVIGGAHFAVESASTIARSFGVSEWIIGIILISLGTSLPELVVSISAAMRGKVDMAIGNIIGSNMANTSVVLGLAALVYPIELTAQKYLFDIATMASATLLLVFITATKLYTKSAGISLVILLGLFLSHTLNQLI